MEEVKRYHVIVKKQIHEKVRLYAAATGRTMSDVVTEAIEEYIKKYPADGDRFKKILEIEEEEAEKNGFKE